jgi:hypothetical protein
MKIVFIVIGALMVLMGGACTAGGIGLAVVVGGDGWIDSDSGRLDTTTHALVSEVADIANEDPDGADFINDLEDFRFRMRAESNDASVPIFIGVGRAGDVSEYLSDVEHDVVNDIEFDNLSIDKTLVPGDRQPDPPIEETFWVESISGTGEQELNWEVRSGAYRFVLMNADGSPGVDVEAKFGLKIPYAMQIAIGLMIVGVIVVLAGVLIILVAARSSPKPPPPQPATTPAPPPAPA